MYTNIYKLIEVNKQKLDYLNDLQSEMENTNEEFPKDLDYITCTNLRMKNSFIHQIQKHDSVKQIVEEKFSLMCELNHKITVTEENLANRLGYY